MKSFLTIVLLSFFSLQQGIAQSRLAANDPAAKVILDKVSAKFKTYKSVQAAFTMNVEDYTGKVVATRTGNLTMKGDKYRIAMKEQEILSNGVDLWNYDANTNEVQISKLDPSQEEITPQKMFSNFYDKDFLYKLNGEKKVGSKVLQEIELTPTNKNQSFHKVYVLIDNATNTLTGMKVLENNKNQIVYTITSFSGKPVLTDETFVFNTKRYPGVEVIDLR